MMGQKKNGFTLIEILVAIAIIGILTATAIPYFKQSATKSRRADGQAALLTFSARMERWNTENNSSYLGAAGSRSSPTNTGTPWIFPAYSPLEGNATLNSSGVPTNKYYGLTIQAATTTTYTLRAAPFGVQATDGYLEIDSTGAKRWDKNNNGSATDVGENSWD